MRYSDFKLVESRGVTARDSGEVYIGVNNPNSTLTIERIYVIKPEDGPAFEDHEQLQVAIDANIPDNVKRVEDNKPSASMKAAIIAHCIDQDNQDQWWIRYLRQIPPAGVHGSWKTFNGYQYGKAAKTENVPIKPADVIPDERARSMQQLAEDIKNNTQKTLTGTQFEPLVEIIHTAVDLAQQGSVSPIPGAAEYSNVVGKYAGEYLGILALVQGGIRKGDIDKMIETLNIQNLEASTVIFPQDKAAELIDSILVLPNGTRLGVSTKIHAGGGAASSLGGIVKQINSDIEQKHPEGVEIIKTLGLQPAKTPPAQADTIGPVMVAKKLGILQDEDIEALKQISLESKDINDIKSDNLRKMTKAQGVAPGSLQRDDYRVYFHALTAIVNQMIEAVNNTQDFADAMMAALNNNNYLQMLTDARKAGDGLTIDYYGKFPAVFKGKPVVANKNYFATGQKGRLGFKLK